MAQDLLTPEEEQQAQEDQELQRLESSYAKPAIEDFRRNAGQDRIAQAKKAAGFVAKNKKWFIGGGAGLAILIPIITFFFWLMLFKNVHIKNLYVSYRWAQFNRGINKTLSEQLELAKSKGIEPNGDANTSISETDGPTNIIEKANKAELGGDAAKPIEQQVQITESSIQSIEGPAESVLSETEIGRSVKAAASEKEATTNVESEIGSKGTNVKDVPETLRDAVEQTRDAENPQETAAKNAEGVMNGSGTFGQLVRDVQGPLVIATFYCIFRDIYVTAKDQINKVLTGGAMGVAQEVNKTADCQKMGKCSMEQAAAVSEKFDDGEKSFTESCGYARATQSTDSSCEEIRPSFTIASIYDKAPGALSPTLKLADAVLDPPTFGKGPVKISAGTACRYVMDSKFQLAMAVIGTVGVAVSAPEGEEWAAAGQVVKRGLITAAATSGGKALIVNAVLTLSGNAFKNLSPIDMGNLTDMGNLAIASGTCKKTGCVKATPEQASRLNEQYRNEKIAQNKKRNIIAKLLDLNSPDSVATRTALNIPTNPTAITARIGNIFANITNPIKFSKSMGANTMALSSQKAYADAKLNDNPYNIDVYVPAAVLYNYSSKTLDDFYDGLDATKKTSLNDQYQRCNEGSAIEALTSHSSTDCTGEDYYKYAGYMFEKNTLFSWALSANNQTNLSSASSSDDTSNSADTTGIKRGEDTAGRPCPSGTKSAGTSKTFAGANIQLCDIGDDTIVNQSAAKAFYDMKQAADKDHITLYGGGFRSYEEQIALRKAHCADWQNTPANSCRPPTAKPGKSMHEEGLAVDFRNSSNRGTAVYAWLHANASRFGIINLESEPWHWSVNGH